jgi:DNA repair exonuclease SbcCD ATPase subunit
MKKLGLFIALILLSSTPLYAQRALTNDDFAAPAPRADKAPADKTSADKANKKDPATTSDAAPTDGKTEAKASSPAEEQKKKAQEALQKKYNDNQKKLNTLDKEKTQSELQLQELRNRLRASAVDPQQYEALAQQIREAEAKVKDLNNQYGATRQSLDAAKQEADTKGYKFKSEDIPKVDKNGRPNPTYYTKNYGELADRQRLAESKIQLYQARLNEARQRTYQSRSQNPNRVGSPYFTDPEVKKAFEEAQTELQKAQEELQKTTEGLDTLRREARSVGVDVR